MTDTVKKTHWVLFKEAWPVFSVMGALAIAMVTGWNNLEALAGSNTVKIDATNVQVEVLKGTVAAKASEFLTDIEFKRLWKDITDNTETIDDVEDTIDALALSDERVKATIELEVTKLRNEIQAASVQQAIKLDDQTRVLQQILLEVRAPD